jgi:glycosyltransferase involved in cell wall biosynthesis
VLGRFEGYAAMRARHSVVVNQREADLLAALAPAARVSVLSVGVNLADLRPAGPPAAAAEVVFCGVMNYAPNVEGVRWFAHDVWPRIRKERPDAHFSIVGSSPVEYVRRLANPQSGISVTGTVPDVRPYVWRAAVSVAPLKTARGVQNKVLEALAGGVPAVVTSPVAEGLPGAALAGCRVADADDSFANAVLMLLARSPDERRAMANKADLESLAWERQLEPIYRICLDAASPSHAPHASTATAPR